MLYILATLISVAKSECFSGSFTDGTYSYDVDVNIGSTTTTVTVAATVVASMGIGFGGTTMDGTYAVILDGEGPTEVILFGTPGNPRGYNEVVGEDNWTIDSDTTAGAIRTVVMTRDNAVPLSCVGCQEFSSTQTNLQIVYAISANDPFSRHVFNGGARLRAVMCPTPAPVTPSPTTAAPTPAPTPRRRRQRTPRPTTAAPTATPTRRRRRKSAAARPGKNRMMTTTTTTPAPRTKSPRTTKAPRNRGRTPSPTPMPTETCDCYSTTLVSRQVIGGSKCYRYEVDCCKDDVMSIILGDGNADKECGITDVMDIIKSVDAPLGVTYSSYYDDKVRGLKLDGLMSGDRFRVCFDKNVVDSTMKGGFIKYQTYGGDVSCKQDRNLPNLCPTVVSNAGSGGVGKTDECACSSLSLLGTPYVPGQTCYKYEVGFCNNNYDRIQIGNGNPNATCNTKVKEVFKQFILGPVDKNGLPKPGLFSTEDTYTFPSGISYKIGRPFAGDDPHARGIEVSGLSDGAKFTICFDNMEVWGSRQNGKVDFLNPRGKEKRCPVDNVLYDLCPLVDPHPTVNNAAGSGGAGKTDPCSCNVVTLADLPFSRSGVSCYKYRVNFCNDNYDSIEMGMGNPEGICGTKIEDIFKTFKTKATGVTYEIGRPFGAANSRGIKISGLSDGDEFQLCFDGSLGSAVRQYGTIDFLNARGREETCPVTDTLFDLCPFDNPPFSGAAVNGVNDVKYFENTAEEDASMTIQTIMWAAFVSFIVSMTIVAIGYFVCIKPSTNTQVYDKVDQKDLI